MQLMFIKELKMNSLTNFISKFKTLLFRPDIVITNGSLAENKLVFNIDNDGIL